MKAKLILFYETLLNNYFYYQKKDEGTAKKMAYASVRNVIGVLIFMFSLVLFVAIIGYFQIHLNLKKNRLIGYLFMSVLVISYLLYTKKYLKPMFDNIEMKKQKPQKNYAYLYVIVVGLFGGLMFVIARLITIYFS